MPRMKPTTKIDEIGKFDIQPEVAFENYRESKRQEQFNIKPPNSDSAGDSIELIFTRSIRDHSDMLLLQKSMLEAQKLQAKTNKQRIYQLHQDQTSLRKHFIEANSFINQCKGKQQTAKKKFDEEVVKQRLLIEKMQEYTHKNEEIIKFREAIKATVDEFEPYETILNDVVKKIDIFDSVRDCMDRCDALMLVQMEIARLDQMKLQEIENMRKHILDVTNEAAFKVLGLKNELTALERLYIEARSECLKWEKYMATAHSYISLKNLNKDRVLDAIYHIFRIIARRGNFNFKVQREQSLFLLNFIKEEVELLNEIVLECHDEPRIDKNKKFNVAC